MTDYDAPTMCHCGQPLHYTDALMQLLVEVMVMELGETMVVTVNGRHWKVPRHYVALHGLKGSEVDKLGFTEVFGDWETG